MPTTKKTTRKSTAPAAPAKLKTTKLKAKLKRGTSATPTTAAASPQFPADSVLMSKVDFLMLVQAASPDQLNNASASAKGFSPAPAQQTATTSDPGAAPYPTEGIFDRIRQTSSRAQDLASHGSAAADRLCQTGGAVAGKSSDDSPQPDDIHFHLTLINEVIDSVHLALDRVEARFL